MKIIGYTRISTDQQDLAKQRYTLLEYAQKQEWLISKFIESDVSTRKSLTSRKIDQLLDILEQGDKLLIVELSRLGRNMVETLNLVNTLTEKGIDVIFTRQPELSTNTPHSKLLLAIYGYFAEAERNYISIRTKQGLAAARAQGKQLGRPKGSRNKKGRILDLYTQEIKKYLDLDLPVTSIMKIINPQLPKPVSYPTYIHFIKNNEAFKKEIK
jgi:DNA invertase Pin-like site-specific DNA recombinase